MTYDPSQTAKLIEEHIEALLDDALIATFPASDPIALTFDAKRNP